MSPDERRYQRLDSRLGRVEIFTLGVAVGLLFAMLVLTLTGGRA